MRSTRTAGTVVNIVSVQLGFSLSQATSWSGIFSPLAGACGEFTTTYTVDYIYVLHCGHCHYMIGAVTYWNGHGAPRTVARCILP